MNDDVFAQMMDGLRGATTSGKKSKLKFDAPADPTAPIELPETEIPPLKPGDPANPDTVIGPPAPVTGVTGPAGSEGAPAVQNDVNRIDLNANEEARTKLPPPAQMMPLPEPLPKEGSFQMIEAGLGNKPSSTQKIAGPRKAAADQGTNVALSTDKEMADSIGPDSRMSALGDKQRGLDKERMASLEQASKAKNMSTEEMIAMALITLLPTIVGGIAGNAVAGGAGAAAGVAGGLQGASQGLGTVMSEKQKNKDQALAQASQAAQRGDQIDAEMGQRQGQLEQLAEHDKTRASNKELTAIKEKGDTMRAASSNSAHLKAANIQAYSHLKAAQISADSAIAKAEAKAAHAEQNGDIKEYQGKTSGFATSMLGAEHVLRQINQPSLLNSFRSWGALKSAIASDDPVMQKYGRAVETFLDAAARDESGAAINEGEYDRYFNMYFPRNTSSQEDVQYAAQLRDSRLRSMLGRSGPAGARVAIDSYQQAFQKPAQQQQSTPPAATQPGNAQTQAPTDKPLTSKWGAGR